MERKPKVIGISGSSRKEGNTESFLEHTLKIITDHNIDCDLITLHDKKIDMDTCPTCKSPCMHRVAVCIQKDDFNPIVQKMIEADGILIGCPVYWGFMPPKLAELLNRAGMVSEGRVSAKKPISVLGLPDQWPEAVRPRSRAWPMTSKGPGLFARKVGGVVTLAQRDGVLTTMSEILLWMVINNFIIATSNYYPDGLEQIGRSEMDRWGRVVTPDGKNCMHVKDTLEHDLEAQQTMDHFAENIAWLVKATYKIRGTPEEIFAESILSSPKWMKPEDRKKALG
jgi:multimeric flavodoxin WrbA